MGGGGGDSPPTDQSYKKKEKAKKKKKKNVEEEKKWRGKSQRGGGCAWRGAELRGCWISSLGEKNKKEMRERNREKKGRKK